MTATTAAPVVVETCACGREFIAKTPARVGVTRSNAARHAASCVDAQAAALAAEQKAARDEEIGEVFANVDDALAAAAARQEKGESLELTPTGKVAKMVRITLDLRISTDGRWLVARLGEGAEAWGLYRVAPSATVRLELVGRFATCTAAFTPANLTR